MSLRSKGFRARKIFNLQEVRVVGQVLGSMFTRAMGRSDRIYYGMASRGYNGQTVFVEAESIPIRQAVVPVLIIALLIVIQFVWKS